MRRRLVPSTGFLRDLKKLRSRNPSLAEAVDAALRLLELDPFHSRLHTHKLKGELASYWACTAAYDLRILFRFIHQPGGEEVLLISLGTHDNIY
jgi:mRNA interferase YafQ